MKLLNGVIVAFLSVTALAAKRSSGDRFSDFFTQSLSSTPLKLDDRSYTKLTTAPRNYSAAILLTALDARFGCKLCQDFQPEWNLLAKSWNAGDKKGESRLILGTLDFADGKEVFQRLMLQTAPVMLFFHPTTGPGSEPENIPTKYDFSVGEQTAEIMHTWISRHLPDGVPHPRVRRPINYVKIVVITTSLLGVVTFATVAYPYLSFLLNNRNLWAAISLFTILLFTSGHMYNQIRKVPYVSTDGKGKMEYFAPGFQSQFGMETQIIAVIYGVLAFATISLALRVPRMKDPKSQQVAVFVWSGVILAMYSFLISIFRIKNGGYPFWLPPF